MAEQTESQNVEETLNPNNANGKSETALESTVTNHNAAESSASDGNSLEHADELMQKGYKAMKDDDFSEAAENFSRALEIRAAKFGELAPECVHTYYKYGCALLYKAQEEADPLGNVPKKEGEGSTKGGSVKISAVESSTSVASNAEQDANFDNQDAALGDGKCVTSSFY